MTESGKPAPSALKPDQPCITVVSGLPRSGTSMMMQMLAAGGLPVLSDDARPADADNPRGYLEYAPVKRLARDASWMGEAVGKAVKVIHLLLKELPITFRYRVILLRRDLREVIGSQQIMLARQGKPGAGLSEERLAEMFAAQLRQVEEWLGAQPNIAVLKIDHREALRDSNAAARKVNAFLGGALDVQAMSNAVDPALYRRRAG